MYGREYPRLYYAMYIIACISNASVQSLMPIITHLIFNQAVPLVKEIQIGQPSIARPPFVLSSDIYENQINRFTFIAGIFSFTYTMTYAFNLEFFTALLISFSTIAYVIVSMSMEKFKQLHSSSKNKFVRGGERRKAKKQDSKKAEVEW
jgi:hypothetical protein